MKSDEFQLWLEFEELGEGEEWNADTEFFNMAVTVAGRQYGLNVWSLGYMKRRLMDGVDIDADESAVGFSHAPDLFVQTCTRAHMEKVIRHLVETNALKESWLVKYDDQE